MDMLSRLMKTKNMYFFLTNLDHSSWMYFYVKIDFGHFNGNIFYHTDKIILPSSTAEHSFCFFGCCFKMIHDTLHTVIQFLFYRIQIK